MSNLIDSLEKARRKDLVELLAASETYTLANRTLVAVRSCRNLILRLFRKEWEPTGMQLLYEESADELAGLGASDLRERLRSALLRELKASGSLKHCETDDQLSVSMLRAVYALYGKRRFALLSPAEAADELKIKCGLRNPETIKRLPTVWLICAVALLIAVPLLPAVSGTVLSARSAILPGALAEIILWLLCGRFLALEKLAQAIALGGANTSFSVQASELSICRWQHAGRFEQGLRALHTLQSRITLLAGNRDKLLQLNAQSEDRLRANLKAAEQLRGTAAEAPAAQEEQRRKLQAIDAENARLNAEIRQRGETIRAAEKQLTQDGRLKSSLEKLLAGKIGELWRQRYSAFAFEPEFFLRLVNDFEWFSFEVVERRLYELARTGDPGSLGKKRGNVYAFEFAVGKQRCAILYQPENKVRVTSLQRSSPPGDVGLSDRQLNDTLAELLNLPRPTAAHGSGDANRLISEMAEQIRQGQEMIGKLNERVDTLALEKKTAELEKRSLLREKEALTEELRQLQNKMRSGQSSPELAKSETILRQRIAELEARLSEKAAEMNALQANFDQAYGKAVQELERQRSQTQRLRDTLDHNKKESLRLQQEFDDLQRSSIDLTNQLHLSESTLKRVSSALDRQKKQNSEQQKTYEELKAASVSMEETIAGQKRRMADIEANRRALEESSRQITESLKSAETRISEQEEKIERLNRSLAERQSQLDSAELFEDYNIRKEFERAFAEAKNEIDIISPWLARFTRDRDFYRMVESALRRNVVVKIRYGFNENRGGADLTREALGRIVASDQGSNKDEWSLLNIYRLHEQFDAKYPGMLITCRQDSHAKLLMVDRSYYLIGSFNFLSYDGLELGRGEIALCDRNRKMIDDIYKRFFTFDRNSPAWITDPLVRGGAGQR